MTLLYSTAAAIAVVIVAFMFLMVPSYMHASALYADPIGLGVPNGYSYFDIGDVQTLFHYGNCATSNCDSLLFYSCRDILNPSNPTRTCVNAYDSAYPWHFKYTNPCKIGGTGWNDPCWTISGADDENYYKKNVTYCFEDGRCVAAAAERYPIYTEHYDLAPLGLVQGGEFSNFVNSTTDVYSFTGALLMASNYSYTPPPPTSISIKPDETQVAAGDTITFTAEWNTDYLGFALLKFYADVEDTTPAKTIFITDPTFDTTEVFGYTYFTPSAYGQPYTPYIELTSSTGAVLLSAESNDTITVSSWSNQAEKQDITYASTFTASKYSDVILGDPVTYSYNLSSNFCTGSGAGVSSKKLYFGYPPQMVSFDTGSTLSVMSGTIVRAFTRTALPYSDFFFPYIKLTCGNATTFKVYLGGSLSYQKAQSISVYEAENERFALPAAWLNGGGSNDYAAGSGTYFASDKHLYKTGEPVKLKWVFNDSFTVGSTALYDDQGGTLLYVFSGSTAAQKNANHYATIKYATQGEYQPYIQIRSTSYNPGNPASYHNYYLGGLATPYPENAIVVTNQVQPIYVNTGATILGTDVGTGGRLKISNTGIFSLDALNFQGFGSTGNVFLDGAQSLLLVVVWAAIWVAEKIYVILSATHIFSFIFDTIHPTEGAHYIMPTQLFRYNLPAGIAGKEFTVSYVTGGNSANVTYLVQLGIMMSLFLWTMGKVLYSRSSH